MTICMVGIDAEEFWEVRLREVLTEHKEKGMEEKAFHSENVSMHIIKAKWAKAGKKIKNNNNDKQKNMKISIQLSRKMQKKKKNGWGTNKETFYHST